MAVCCLSQHDKDKDGVLNPDEFTVAIRSLVQANLKGGDLESLYDLISRSDDELGVGDFIDFFCSPANATGKKFSVPTGGTVITTIAMSADQQFVAFGGANCSAQMYSIQNGNLVVKKKYECVT